MHSYIEIQITILYVPLDEVILLYEKCKADLYLLSDIYAEKYCIKLLEDTSVSCIQELNRTLDEGEITYS